MFGKKPFQILCIISIILLFLMISCKATPGDNSGKESQDLKAIIPTSDVNFQIPPDGSNIYEFTEEDVVSWMNDFSSQNPEITLSNLIVVLDDGICTISGVLEQKNTSSNPLISSLAGKVLLVLSINTGENGQPSITLNSLSFDSVTLPEFVLDQISTMINESIQASIESDLEGGTIDRIQIDNGLIQILVSE